MVGTYAATLINTTADAITSTVATAVGRTSQEVPLWRLRQRWRPFRRQFPHEWTVRMHQPLCLPLPLHAAADSWVPGWPGPLYGVRSGRRHEVSGHRQLVTASITSLHSTVDHLPLSRHIAISSVFCDIVSSSCCGYISLACVVCPSEIITWNFDSGVLLCILSMSWTLSTATPVSLTLEVLLTENGMDTCLCQRSGWVGGCWLVSTGSLIMFGCRDTQVYDVVTHDYAMLWHTNKWCCDTRVCDVVTHYVTLWHTIMWCCDICVWCCDTRLCDVMIHLCVMLWHTCMWRCGTQLCDVVIHKYVMFWHICVCAVVIHVYVILWYILCVMSWHTCMRCLWHICVWCCDTRLCDVMIHVYVMLWYICVWCRDTRVCDVVVHNYVTLWYTSMWCCDTSMWRRDT